MDDVANVALGDVRRDLEEDRDIAALLQGRAGLGHPAGQLLQRSLGLQVAQPWGVGRGHVDGEIVRQPPQPLQPGHIVADAVGGVLVGAEVRPDHAAAAPAGQPFREGLQALVVEAHAVDHRPIRRQPEQTRAGVSVLRLRRHRPALDEAEAGGEHGVGRLRVLVEPCRQADAVGQPQPPHLDRQSGIVRPGDAGA